MSKLREHVEIKEGELESPAEGDLSPYVVFTQLTDGGPFIYAGWLDARDDAMAIQFAREHYGRDQKCTAVLAIARRDIAGTEAEFAPSSEKGAERDFQVFIQADSGDPYVSGGKVKAASSAEALEKARRDTADVKPDSIWVVPRDRIIATDEDDLVWRLTDQSYRMARGYSSEVRAKWEKIRARPDLEEYEKEDLKEAF
jgi:1,2-phenylacetyl-CoA epoxidase PaaB subunit